jgi:hypothetical protein
MTAGAAQRQGRVAAAVEEEQRLGAARDGVADRRNERAAVASWVRQAWGNRGQPVGWLEVSRVPR